MAKTDNVITLTIEIDFNYPMEHADSDPFCNFRRGDWVNYLRDQIVEKVEEIANDSGAEINITDEEGEQVV